MKGIIAVLLFFFVATSVAVQIPRIFLERSEPLPIPLGWKRATSMAITQESTRVVNLIFAVKQRNLDILDETFWAVSTPGNERYGQHLTLAQIAELVGPSQKSIHTITNWLRNNGVEDYQVTYARDFIKCQVTPAFAAKLFRIEYHSYRHEEAGITVDAAVGPYSVPAAIGELLDFVSGVVGFPDVEQSRVRINPKPQASKTITPSVVRARYNCSNAIGSNPNNMHAVAEFQAQYYLPSDLKQFWTDYVSYAPFEKVAKVIGTDGAQPGIEASLDVEYIMGVSPNITTWFYSMKNFNFWDDLTRWAAELANETTIPWVHSISYGSQGDYPSNAYMNRLSQDLQKIGTRGVSIMFASGDSGSGCGASYSSCDCEFFPSFPAVIPYVTSVGATRFLSGNTGPEGAVYLFKSGGGFSIDPFDQPSYQTSAVSNYFSSGVKMPQSCAYNASGRGTPDVSALGDEYFQVINGGSVISVGGTSASSPSFSAVISLLNDIRLNKGKTTLGFLNPWIYKTATSTPGAFFDVTVGNNVVTGCCTTGNPGGFDCAVGWDPVTGVGTPNYAVLSTLM